MFTGEWHVEIVSGLGWFVNTRGLRDWGGLGNGENGQARGDSAAV